MRGATGFMARAEEEEEDEDEEEEVEGTQDEGLVGGLAAGAGLGAGTESFRSSEKFGAANQAIN